MRSLLALIPAICLAATTATSSPNDCPAATSDVTVISDAKFYIEDNAADGDIGVHGFFGDDSWNTLCVFAPDGSVLLNVTPDGPIGELGLSGFFFESHEPPYAEYEYSDLVADFAEGDYLVRAVTPDGETLEGIARFSTVVALAPTILTPASTMDEDGELPVTPLADTRVSWTPVTDSRDGRPVTIAGYQVILVNESWKGSTDTFAQPIFDVRVGSDRTELIVPRGFFDAGAVYEIEVLAIEESGNQTIAGASFFRVAG